MLVTTGGDMAKARGNDTVRLLGFVRRNRMALMMSTALQASTLLVLSPPAARSPRRTRARAAPWSAGAASIGSTASNTTITQCSQRAAINWQSFNVGGQQWVTFSQPSASASR